MLHTQLPDSKDVLPNQEMANKTLKIIDMNPMKSQYCPKKNPQSVCLKKYRLESNANKWRHYQWLKHNPSCHAMVEKHISPRFFFPFPVGEIIGLFGIALQQPSSLGIFLVHTLLATPRHTRFPRVEKGVVS